MWAQSGKELFYVDGMNTMMAVPVHTTPVFSSDTPTKLFDWPHFPVVLGRGYDVSADGQRFLMIKDTARGDPASAPASIVVVLNWVEELKRLVPTK